MAFMRHVFYNHDQQQPRTRYKRVKGKKVAYQDGPYGYRFVGAVLRDGSTVIVDVKDGDWHATASAVPSAEIIGTVMSRNGDEWCGEYVGPHCDRSLNMTFAFSGQAADAVIKAREEAINEELTTLADPVKWLERELKCHDWYCAMSDAPGVCAAGEAHFRKIKQIMGSMPVDDARRLFVQYAPKDFTCPV